MGRVRMASEWSWAEAENEYQRAVALEPGAFGSHRGYSLHYLAPMGRFEEAIAEAKKAVELDPVNVVSISTLGNIYYYARRYDLAEAEITKALELEPNYALAHFFRARIYKEQEKHTEAIREAERYVALVGRTGRSLAMLAATCLRGGREVEGRKLIQELQALSRQSYFSPAEMSQAYASLKDADSAFAWLEKAFETRDVVLVRLKIDPAWDPIRDDPRYADLVRRIGFPA